MTYYNEWDSFAAAWLRNLIAAGELPQGEVDESDIRTLDTGRLSGTRDAHFFAGIGGWPLAMQLAGWPKDLPLWTGSCPCQPFSGAGKQLGEADERHLWPAFRRLIAECRPPIVVGEQVASALGREWLAGVRADLEELGYEVGAADLCAAGVGAPHIRQRLYWVAYTESGGFGTDGHPLWQARHADISASLGGLADSPGARSRRLPVREGRPIQAEADAVWDSAPDGLAYAERWATERQRLNLGGMADPERIMGGRGEQEPWRRPDRGAAHWGDTAAILCRDGKYRRIPVEPSLFPLADGIPNRVGILRGSGNAIVPQVAATFLSSVLDVLAKEAE